MKNIYILLLLFFISAPLHSQDAKELYSSAKAALENGNSDECIRYIKACQEALGGSNAKIESIKCQAYMEKGEWVQAAIAYTNFEKLIPVSAQVGEAYEAMLDNKKEIWKELEKIEKEKKEKFEQELKDDLERAQEADEREDAETDKKAQEINKQNEQKIYQMALQTKEKDLLELYQNEIGSSGKNIDKINAELDKQNNPNKYIIQAAKDDNIKEVEYLIKLGADVNLKSNGNSSLHIAVQNKSIELLNKLISLGADIESVNYTGETPLLLAIKNGFYNGSKSLLTNQANPKAVNAEGNSALYYCLQYNDYMVIELIANLGVDINQKIKVSGSSVSPLYYAVYHSKNTVMASKLIALGAKINDYSNLNWTPLMAAVYTDNYSMATLLINNKADLNLKGPYNWTALHFASRQRNTEMIKLLLTNGAQKSPADQWKRTPKKVAREHEFKEVVKVFKEF